MNEFLTWINPNNSNIISGAFILNPIETNLTDYINVTKLNNYMINLKKKQVINKKSKKIQKYFINISQDKKNNIKFDHTISYDKFIKTYM